ncbi:hypothetical protein HYW67_00475 [Candidatus Parcubacteria bacterium]|nr:hypothetical protein [Candidatus Parcubacteria bacterium]
MSAGGGVVPFVSQGAVLICPDCLTLLVEVSGKRGSLGDVGMRRPNRYHCNGCGEEWARDGDGGLLRYHQL